MILIPHPRTENQEVWIQSRAPSLAGENCQVVTPSVTCCSPTVPGVAFGPQGLWTRDSLEMTGKWNVWSESMGLREETCPRL